MIFLEFDLAGAEWVIVAYLSGDANMIGVVESGKSPHIVTGSLISSLPEDIVLQDHKLVGNNTDPRTIERLREPIGRDWLDGPFFWPRSMSVRQMGKKSNHGLNYNMKYRRAALEWEIPEPDARPIVEGYSEHAYPGIKDYWKGIVAELRKGRTLTNCFGRKVKLMGEWGQELFDQAYSFKPQSTVGDITLQAMCSIYEDDDLLDLRLGAQVHDSLLLQAEVPASTLEWDYLELSCKKVIQHLSPELEYNGYKFRLNVDIKIGINWGDMRSTKVSQIQEVYEELVESAAHPQESACAETEASQMMLAPGQGTPPGLAGLSA